MTHILYCPIDIRTINEHLVFEVNTQNLKIQRKGEDMATLDEGKLPPKVFESEVVSVRSVGERYFESREDAAQSMVDLLAEAYSAQHVKDYLEVEIADLERSLEVANLHLSFVKDLIE